MPPPLREGVKAVTNVDEPEAWPEFTEAQRNEFYNISLYNPDVKSFVRDLTKD